jgi:autotransporter-associated beta strand protein
VPASGNDLVFPDGASQLTAVNNVTGLNLNSITFTGSGGGYAVSGNGVSLAAGIKNQSSDSQTVNLTSLAVNISQSFDGGGAGLQIGAAINIDFGATLSLAGSNTTTANAISGNVLITDVGGNITKNAGSQWNILGNVTVNTNSTFTSNASTVAASGDFLDLSGNISLGGIFLTLTGNNSVNPIDGFITTSTGTIIAKAAGSEWDVNGGITLSGDSTMDSNAASFASAHDSFNVTSSGFVNLGGHTLTLNGNTSTNTIAGAVDGGGNITKNAGSQWNFAGPITLNSNGFFSSNSNTIGGPDSLNVTNTGTIDLNNFTLTLTGTNSTNSINGSLNARGNIIKDPGSQWNFGGPITLNASSTFTSNSTSAGSPDTLNVTSTGSIDLNSFNLTLAGTNSDNSLAGSLNARGTLTRTGGRWTESGSVTLNAASTFISNGGTGSEGLEVTGPVNLGSNILTLDGTGNINNDISGTLSGAGSGGIAVVKNGAGRWVLGGNNNYTGQTTINAGALEPDSNTGFGTGPTLVNAGGTLYVNIGTMEVASFANNLTINGTGNPSPSPYQGAIFINGLGSNLTVNAPLALGSDSTIVSNTTTANFINLTSPVNIGTHNLTISGQLNYVTQGGITGTGTVNNQGFALAGTGSIQGPVSIASGASLRPGLLSTSGTSTPGVLNTGNLAFSSGSTFTETINGATAGTSYSQVVVNGAINLANANLATNLGFTPTAGSSFVMMESTGSVTGTFNGLPDGATVTINSIPFLIHYVNSPTVGGVGPNTFFGRVVLASAPLVTVAGVTASQNPAQSGQGVTITVSVVGIINAPAAQGGVGPLGGANLPGIGTVQFMDGGSPLGSPVTLANGSGSITPPLGAGTHSITAVFTTANGDFTNTTSPTYVLTVNTTGWHDVLTGDFLGNGKQDIAGMTAAGQWWLAVSNGTSFTNQLWGSWNPNAGWQNVMTGDFLGNGKQDIAGMTSGGQWWVAVSNGSSFTNQLWIGWNPNVTWVDVKVGDFSGDGKADIVGRYSQTGQWWVAQSTGSSFTNSLWTTWNPNVTWVDVNVGHFAGSIRSDLTGRWLQGGSWWTAVSTGSSFTTGLWASWNPNVTWADVKVGDFNNDGKTDLTARWLQGGSWWTAVSTGSSFTTGLWASWNPNATWVDVQVGDFNDDGKVDIAARYLQGGSWYVGISNGTSFVTGLWGGWSPAANWVDVSAAEIDGDKFTDLVGRYGAAGQWWAAISNGSNGFTNQLWTTWAP